MEKRRVTRAIRSFLMDHKSEFSRFLAKNIKSKFHNCRILHKFQQKIFILDNIKLKLGQGNLS